nr:non-ribosomal peptide synthetase [Microbispora sp.]
MANRTCLPLSAAQHGIWVAHHLDPTGAKYTIAEHLDVAGPVDPALFRAAVQRVWSEFEAFRVSVVEHEHGVCQVLDDVAAPAVPFIDLSRAPSPEAAAHAWMEAEAAGPVDLSRPPLLFIALLKLADDRFFWFQRCHHIIADGFTGQLTTQRIAEVYGTTVDGSFTDESFGSLRTLLDDDADYRSSERFELDRQYWMKKVADPPEPVRLASGRTPSSPGVLRRSAEVPGLDLRALRRATGHALPVVVMAAAAAYLHRLTGSGELVFGLPVAARTSQATRTVPGMVSNMIPIRLSMTSRTSLRELARQVSREMREGLRHQRYRYEDIQRDAGLGGGHNTLVGMRVNVMRFDYELRLGGHRVTAHNLAVGHVDDLDIGVYDRGNGQTVRIDFDANPGLYSPEEVAIHQRHFLLLLERAVADPDMPIGQVDILTPHERHQLLTEWNNTDHPHPPTLLPDLFQQQAAHTPHATAIIDRDHHTTYTDLNTRANRLAHHLISHGAAPEHLIALALPRTTELITTILAITKTGAAYLPIDHTYPTQRIHHMLHDAQPTTLITTTHLAPTLTPTLPPTCHILLLDHPHTTTTLTTQPTTNPTNSQRKHPLHPHHPAYVIYTSGSTGTPKGVVISHVNVVRLFESTAYLFDFGQDDTWSLFHSYAFDFSVWELWGPSCMAVACSSSPRRSSNRHPTS